MNDQASGAYYVTSPFVGVFHRRPSQDAAPYVGVGDAVAHDQTVCLIEAMKLMNDIHTDRAGVISEILAEDGAQVEFGQWLFKIAT